MNNTIGNPVKYEPKSVALLSCNLDDMTGEDISFATEILLESGALDVWTTPIYMKKGRPAVSLSCLCAVDNRAHFANLMLEHTTSLGVRESIYNRYVLERESAFAVTPMGPVRVKKCVLPSGVVREKAEYDDVALLARENGKSLAEVRSEIRTEAREKQREIPKADEL